MTSQTTSRSAELQCSYCSIQTCKTHDLDKSPAFCPTRTHEKILARALDLYNKDSTKSDVWVEDTAIAAVLVQATAEWLGLGSCWIQIRNRPHDAEVTAEGFIQQLLGLPEHIKVTSIISIGHPAEAKPELPASELEYHKVKHNHYSTVL